ncbi:hypothetical protein ACF1FC_11090 [Streptomyces sp. NPDC014344]|uniref:hypothetical protein n=1 Tax=Streptomyces sp. NPDC014344 TaxID=3364871 RepID=UPI0036F80B92
MTDRQRASDEASTALWHRYRFVRWLAVLAYTGVVFGLCVVVWHWARGKSWDDSFSFALTVTVSTVVGQWIAAVILRRAGRGDD